MGPGFTELLTHTLLAWVIGIVYSRYDLAAVAFLCLKLTQTL